MAYALELFWFVAHCGSEWGSSPTSVIMAKNCLTCTQFTHTHIYINVDREDVEIRDLVRAEDVGIRIPATSKNLKPAIKKKVNEMGHRHISWYSFLLLWYMQP